MAIVLDTLFEGRGYSCGEDGKWYATKSFLVSDDGGALITEVSATLAVASAYPRNSVHPSNPALTVNSWSSEGNVGPGVWKVRVSWAIPENGGSHPEETPANLLDQTPVVQWSVRTIEIPMEFDADSRFVCNSAGFPPDTPSTHPTDIDVLTITRHEPLYDIDRCRAVRGKVSASGVTLGGTAFSAGQVRCARALPAAEFPVGTTPIKMSYEFEYADFATHPFQTYFTDRGSYGWVTIGGATIAGPIGFEVTADGVTQFQQVTSGVLLDGTGKPLSTEYKVGYKSANGLWKGGTPVAFPHIADAAYTQPADITAPSAWIRRYRRLQSADFSILGL
jgi:hypothetical protein